MENPEEVLSAQVGTQPAPGLPTSYDLGPGPSTLREGRRLSSRTVGLRAGVLARPRQDPHEKRAETLEPKGEGSLPHAHLAATLNSQPGAF